MNIFICHEDYSRKANINIHAFLKISVLKFACREIGSLTSIADRADRREMEMWSS